jgi:5,10-methylenetetrahydromethanopterin reductase
MLCRESEEYGAGTGHKDRMTPMVEIWSMSSLPSLNKFESMAVQYEQAGFYGIVVSDSQNLEPDPFVSITLAGKATTHLRLGTGVANPLTRHPAVMANLAATINHESGRRFILGLGRGDSSVMHLGYGLAPLRRFEQYVEKVNAYLKGSAVPFDSELERRGWPGAADMEYGAVPEENRLRWLPDDPKVPLDISGGGPKVLGIAARQADRVTFVLGPDTERLRWGIDHVRRERSAAGLDPDSIKIGATIYVAPHPDWDVARGLNAGRVASNARWLLSTPSSGHAPDGSHEVFAEVTRNYDMNHHTLGSSPQTSVLTADVIDSLSVSGPPEHCVTRLREITALGLNHLWITTYWRGSDPSVQSIAQKLLFEEVLPHIS